MPGQEKSIFEVLVCILLIGNVNFANIPNTNCCKIVNIELVKRITDTLKLDHNMTADALVTLKTKMFTKEFDKNRAEDVRDAWAKCLYGKLFDMISSAIRGQREYSKTNWIGMLDINGFEIFQENSFEQLCINYSNEKMQQHFINYIFKKEKIDYDNEGIFIDTPRIEETDKVSKLIEDYGKGILYVLDDEIKRPGPSNQRLIDNFHLRYTKKPYSDVYSIFVKNPRCFTIKHYAGDVTYNIEKFLEKAKEEMSMNIYNIMHTSEHPILRKLFGGEEFEQFQKRKSVALQFMESLKSLLIKVEDAVPHYIKCIRPNSCKLKEYINEPLVKSQLMISGIFHISEFCYKKYAFKIPKDEFIRQYKPLLKVETTTNQIPAVKEIVSNADIKEDQVKIGKTQVFINPEEKAILDTKKDQMIAKILRRLSAKIKGYLSRIHYRRLKEAQPLFIDALKINTFDAYKDVLEIASKRMLCFKTKEHIRCERNKIILEKTVTIIAKIELLLPKSPEDVVIDLVSLVAEADALKIAHDSIGKAKLAIDLAYLFQMIRNALIEYIKSPLAYTISYIEEILQKATINKFPDEELVKKAVNIFEKIKLETKAIDALDSAVEIGGPTNEDEDFSKTVKYEHIEKAITDLELLKPYYNENAEIKVAEAKNVIHLRKILILILIEEIITFFITIRKHVIYTKLPEYLVIQAFIAKRSGEQQCFTELLQKGIKEKSIEILEPTLEQITIRKITISIELITIAKTLLIKLKEIYRIINLALSDPSIELIDQAMKLVEENEIKGDFLDTLKLLKASMVEGVVALNVMEIFMMERVMYIFHKLKSYNQIQKGIMALCYSVDEEQLANIQWETSLFVNDKKLQLKRYINKRFLKYFSKKNEKFELDKYIKLRDREEWATGTWYQNMMNKKEERLEKWLSWQSKPMLKSLLVKKSMIAKHFTNAIDIFKDILECMGDASNHLQKEAVLSVISIGIANRQLRAEIYYQIMKQLNKNQNYYSRKQGWNLMGICFKLFAPSYKLSLFIEHFIRANLTGDTQQKMVILLAKAMIKRELKTQKRRNLEQIRSMIAYRSKQPFRFQ